MAEPTCGACRWFNPPRSIGTYGSCRRFPPMMVEGDEGWPYVWDTDWCGEWAAPRVEPYFQIETQGAATTATFSVERLRDMQERARRAEIIARADAVEWARNYAAERLAEMDAAPLPAVAPACIRCSSAQPLWPDGEDLICPACHARYEDES